MHDDRWHFDPASEGLEAYWWYNEQLSRRKRYLFMAAVGRRVATLMTEPACARAVKACEEYAEGVIDEGRFVDLAEQGAGARLHSRSPLAAVQAAHDFVAVLIDEGKLNECVDCGLIAFGYAAAAAAGELPADTDLSHSDAIERSAAYRSGCAAADREFTALCLNVFGPNPFRPVAFDPAWRSDTAVSLARHMYESRDFSAMPILADALQDAGCEDAAILSHCRDANQPHVRGCWAVDLVLGKS